MEPVVRPKDVPELERVRSIRLYAYHNVSWWYLAYNFANPLLAKREAREAITFALNRVDLLRAHLGTGDLLSGPFTPESPFYNWDVKPRRYAPTRAAELLEGLGYERKGRFLEKEGQVLKLTLLVEKGGQEVRGLCLDIQSQLKQVGIKLKVRFEDTAKFNELAFKAGEFDLVLHSWSFRRFENLRPLFHSAGNRNFIGYASPSADRLLDERLGVYDPERLRGIYRRLHEELHRDLPYTFLWSLNARAAVASKYRDVHIAPHGFFTHIHSWSLRPR